MRSWFATIVGVLAGCGSVAKEQPDASVPHDGTGLPLDGARAPLCDPTGTFDALRPLTGFSTTAPEATPRLTADELELYFTMLPSGDSTYNLYRAQRTATSLDFGTPVPLTEANSTSDDFNPSVSSDGLSLFFESTRATGEMNHLYTSTRSSRAAEFTAPSKVANINSTATSEREIQPFVTADGQELWFASSRAGGLGSEDIYRALWNGFNFSNISAVTAVSTSAMDWLPTLSADKLTIYLASDRPNGKGRRDIWTAHRVSVNSDFSTPTPVLELNTASDDVPGWLSADNCRLYISSDRAGNTDIYVATRHPM